MQNFSFANEIGLYENKHEGPTSIHDLGFTQLQPNFLRGYNDKRYLSLEIDINRADNIIHGF